MRKKISHLNEVYQSRTMGFVPKYIQCSSSYRVVILFLLIIITVLSPPAYSEAIKNPNCDASAITTMINDIDMKDKEETGEIDTVEVSKITQKYIPEGCDLMMVIFALNNSGFKLRHLRSDAFIASIVFRSGLISSSTLELVIEYQSGYSKIVTGRVMSISF